MHQWRTRTYLRHSPTHSRTRTERVKTLLPELLVELQEELAVVTHSESRDRILLATRQLRDEFNIARLKNGYRHCYDYAIGLHLAFVGDHRLCRIIPFNAPHRFGKSNFRADILAHEIEDLFESTGNE